MNCIVVDAVGDAEGKASGLDSRVERMRDWRTSPVLKYASMAVAILWQNARGSRQNGNEPST